MPTLIHTKCKNAIKIAGTVWSIYLVRCGEGGVKKEKLMTSFMDGPLESMTKRSEATEAVENAHEAPHHP